MSPSDDTQHSARASPDERVEQRQAGPVARRRTRAARGARWIRAPSARAASTPRRRDRPSARARRGRSCPPASAARGTCSVRWRRCQWPATGITPKFVYSVRSLGRPGRHDDAPELRRRRAGPAPLEQLAPEADALLLGLDHQLGHLLHPAELDGARVADEVAVGARRSRSSRRLRGDELDERALLDHSPLIWASDSSCRGGRTPAAAPRDGWCAESARTSRRGRSTRHPGTTDRPP